MEYNNPQLLWLGVLTAMFWAISYWSIFKKPQLYIPSYFEKNKMLLVSKFIIFLIGITSWIYLTIAIMQPRVAKGYAKNKIEVNDIYFVVDTSLSMLADDFPPNRLEVAKDKILEFVNLRPTDRIGIVIFGEKVFTYVPLSTDLELIRDIVPQIRSGLLGPGTNIGDSIGLATGRLAGSLAKNKIIVLLTDGVQNVGSLTPIQSAEQAADLGIRVYTIGIGASKNAQIPRGGVSKRFYQNIPGGSIDTETLKKMSQITKAKSFLADTPESLKKVLEEINKLEKTEIDSTGRILYEELYIKYLLIGFILLVLTEFSRRFIVKEVS